MNTKGTSEHSVTVGLPRFRLIGPDGVSIVGRFDSAVHAADWARRTWPHLDQDPDRTGKGWDVEAVDPILS